MRKFLTLGLLFALSLPGYSQNHISDTTQYVYCEIVGTARLFSNKVTIEVDFGEHARFFSQDRVMKDESGRPIIFNSMVDALNHMGEMGWEFMQAYVVTIGQQNVYHWLLKKRRYPLRVIVGSGD